MLNRLATVKPGLNYLTGSLSGAAVSHKNGFFEYDEGFVDNDLRIVRFQRRSRRAAFVVTFLSEGVPTKYAEVLLGQQLAQLAFAYFRAVYVDQVPEPLNARRTIKAVARRAASDRQSNRATD